MQHSILLLLTFITVLFFSSAVSANTKIIGRKTRLNKLSLYKRRMRHNQTPYDSPMTAASFPTSGLTDGITNSVTSIIPQQLPTFPKMPALPAPPAVPATPSLPFFTGGDDDEA